MMDAMDAIMTRRSIRAYTDEPIGEDLVEATLKAAMAAPSAGNQQPWHFVVVDDRATLDAIPEYHQYSAMLRQAPLAIVVCSDGGQPGGLDAYWPQDCAAATENLLLAAHALGLGAVWLGVYPDTDRITRTRALLGLPDNITPFCIIAMGHPAEPAGPADRYEASRVHRNRW